MREKAEGLYGDVKTGSVYEGIEMHSPFSISEYEKTVRSSSLLDKVK